MDRGDELGGAESRCCLTVRLGCKKQIQNQKSDDNRQVPKDPLTKLPKKA